MKTKWVKKSKMKVLLVCKSLPDSVIGGIQTHVWNLSNYLLRSGHEVTILAAGSILKGTRKENRQGRTVIKLPCLPLRFLYPFNVWLDEMGFNVMAKHWVKRNQDRFDIVHVHGRSGFLFDKAELTCPLIVTFHGLSSQEFKYEKKSIQTVIHNYYARREEARLVTNSDLNIFVGDTLAREMAETYNLDHFSREIIPNGINVESYNKNVDCNTILFVGRLRRLKGVDVLIRSFKASGVNKELVIIGDGEDKPRLESLVSELGLEKKVTFTGSKGAEAISEYIKTSWLLVLPSFYESQGIVLLEALTQGIPVISTNLDSIRETIRHGHNGYLFEPGNEEELAFWIRHLSKNPKKYLQMGKRGFSDVCKKYDWEKIGARIELEYSKMIKRPVTCGLG